jgi:hypothetical protein
VNVEASTIAEEGGVKTPATVGVQFGGNDKSGAVQPPTTWSFAGTLSDGLNPAIHVTNPNATPVEVTLTYTWGDGRITKDTYIVAAGSALDLTAAGSSGAKTLSNFYNCLKTYYDMLSQFQVQGALLVAEAYNHKYMTTKDKPAKQYTDYVKGSFRTTIQEGLDEYVGCTESLVASWSNAHNPIGLAPDANAIFADADSIFRSTFGRVFVRQADTLYDNIHDILLIGPPRTNYRVSEAEQTWRPVRLKYYDSKQQKLINDSASVGVARYHVNCDAGD